MEIAGEKAGIIKPGRVLVTATQDGEVFKVFTERAEELAAEVVHVGYDTSYTRTGSSLSSSVRSLLSAAE